MKIILNILFLLIIHTSGFSQTCICEGNDKMLNEVLNQIDTILSDYLNDYYLKEDEFEGLLLHLEYAKDSSNTIKCVVTASISISSLLYKTPACYLVNHKNIIYLYNKKTFNR